MRQLLGPVAGKNGVRSKGPRVLNAVFGLSFELLSQFLLGDFPIKDLDPTSGKIGLSLEQFSLVPLRTME